MTNDISKVQHDNIAPVSSPVNPVVSSVAENVSQFLNGIRATFRQDNVQVTENIRQQKGISKQRSNDGKQN